MKVERSTFHFGNTVHVRVAGPADQERTSRPKLCHADEGGRVKLHILPFGVSSPGALLRGRQGKRKVMH